MNKRIVVNSLKELIEEFFFSGGWFSKSLKSASSFRNVIRAKRYYENQKAIELSMLFKNRSISLVIDVGANRGQFGKYIRSLGYKGLILSFEPFPESFQMLSETSKDDRNWRVYKVALGSQPAFKSFNFYKDSAFNSFLAGDGSQSERYANRFEDSGSIEVEIKTFDSVWSQIKEKVNANEVFLKLDTQGYDLEVFKGISEIRNQIKYLITEMSVIPIYKGMPSYIEALNYFEREGFKPMAFIPVSRNHNAKAQLIEFDCLLVRDGQL